MFSPPGMFRKDREDTGDMELGLTLHLSLRLERTERTREIVEALRKGYRGMVGLERTERTREVGPPPPTGVEGVAFRKDREDTGGEFIWSPSRINTV